MDIKHAVELLRLSVNVLQQLNRLLGGNPPSRAAKPIRSARRDTAAPPVVPPPAPPPVSRRRGGWLGATLGMLTAGTAAGLTAYAVVRRRQRAIRRARPMHAPLPPELLQVLAAPGGGGALVHRDGGLMAPGTGLLYPVCDGIPDFLGPDESSPIPALEAASASQALAERLRRGAAQALVSGVSLGHRTREAAYAGAVAWAASGGWCLSVPCGTGTLELEMARANPSARLLCVHSSWDVLREARLRAVEANLPNLYFARASAELLPLQSGVFASAWSAHGFHSYRHVEQAMVELTRAVKPGGVVAGASLVRNGGRAADALLARMTSAFPGTRGVTTHFHLLAAAGLRDLRGVRYGPVVGFVGEKG